MTSVAGPGVGSRRRPSWSGFRDTGGSYPRHPGGAGYRGGATGVMAGRSLPCREVCRHGIELCRAEPVTERRHVGIRIDQFGIDDPSAQRRRVVLRTFVRQIRTVFAAVAIDLVTAD